jgi:hypothetical protein
VAEVWVFKDGAFQLYTLATPGYRPIERSALLPELDFALLARFVVRADTPQALREFEQAIR